MGGKQRGDERRGGDNRRGEKERRGEEKRGEMRGATGEDGREAERG